MHIEQLYANREPPTKTSMSVNAYKFANFCYFLRIDFQYAWSPAIAKKKSLIYRSVQNRRSEICCARKICWNMKKRILINSKTPQELRRKYRDAFNSGYSCFWKSIKYLYYFSYAIFESIFTINDNLSPSHQISNLFFYKYFNLIFLQQNLNGK